MSGLFENFDKLMRRFSFYYGVFGAMGFTAVFTIFWSYVVQTVSFIHSLGWGIWLILGLVLALLSLLLTTGITWFVRCFQYEMQNPERKEKDKKAKASSMTQELDKGEPKEEIQRRKFVGRAGFRNNTMNGTEFSFIFNQTVDSATLFVEIEALPTIFIDGASHTPPRREPRQRLATIKDKTKGERINVTLYKKGDESGEYLYYREQSAEGEETLFGDTTFKHNGRIVFNCDGEEEYFYFIARKLNKNDTLEVIPEWAFDFRQRWEQETA